MQSEDTPEPEITPEMVGEALRREFGYAPSPDDGEKWVVFRERCLLVFHPERLPRIYKRGASGPTDYVEMDPTCGGGYC